MSTLKSNFMLTAAFSAALTVLSCGRSTDSSKLTDESAAVVEFHIAKDTGNGAWNTKDTMVRVQLGQTLRIVNDDSIVHQMHTNGTPCSHGNEIAPGASGDCVISQKHNPEVDGTLYDHNAGPSAAFWLLAEDVVEFHIAKDTGSKPWNTKDKIVRVKLGQTLRIVNDDSITHQLHTNGAPCSHGEPIAPGASGDCVISAKYNALKDGALYDHDAGPSAAFWLRADDVVEFSVPANTGSGVWNTKDTMVNVSVGQVLRFTNSDSVNHQLHTNGAPCPHGDVFAPGKSWDCEIASEFDATKSGPLYDHAYGPKAQFWIKASK